MWSRKTWSTITNSRPSIANLAAIAVTLAVIHDFMVDVVAAQDDGKKVEPKNAPKKAETPDQKPGILINDPRAMSGYNLINPNGYKTYLFDNEGRVVQTWTSEHRSSAAVYLLDNGHLFRPAEATNRKPGFQGPAAGGRLQEFDWDGNLVWDFEYHSDKRLPHHDAIKLPNGNALLICWEKIDEKEAVAMGRRPETVKDSHLQPDCLVEIKPTGKTTGEVVWEWRSWDHLIQDRDKSKPNFGNVAEHPELFDLNYIHGEDDMVSQLMATKDGREKLRALGYVGSAPASPGDAKKDPPKSDPAKNDADHDKKTDATKDQAKNAPKKDQRPRRDPDWMHTNAVAYNAELDQIALSSPHFHEIWIIDHSTTTQEAKGHTGGRWGKGGDILYRWGNPRAYRNGTKLDQRLFFQHNVQWIPKGFPGEGHLLIFNNGAGRKPVEYSSVDELVPPTDQDGNYIREKRGPFGPKAPLWSYSAPNKKDFYSWFISGAQRLSNGNTLINSGANGIVFEVTPENEIVWKFVSPFRNFPAPPKKAQAARFESLPRFARDALGMKEDQRKKLDEIDRELNAKLEKALTLEQRKILAEPSDVDVSKVPAGEYLFAFKLDKLKLTEDQSKELQILQKEFDPKIAMLLTEDQKRMVDDFKKGVAPPKQGGPARVAGNTLFRATRYELNHPAFKGKTITPGKSLLEFQAELENAPPKPKAKAAEDKTPAVVLAQGDTKKVDAKVDSAKKIDTPLPAIEKQGVLLNDARAMPGYNLINPMGAINKTYLFNNEGRVVHSWTSQHSGGLAAYVLPNGHLFRSAEAVNRKPGFQGPAAGGRIQEFDWDGNLVWDFEYHSEKRLPHHDAIKLPNGNALLICWEMIDEKEAIAKGRRPETVKDSHLQPDCLVEIKPTGKTTGEVVWEWRSWDHLIQDRDKSKPNFGNVAEHPERFDVNYMHGDDDMVSQLMATKDGREKLRALGYVGSAPASPGDGKKPDAAKGETKDTPKKDKRPPKNPDWMHVNAVDYNAELDQIALSSPHFHEIWIIDHSTTTEQAKGRTGGRWGKGGDILYRWGNPRAYRNGTKLDQRFFGQHNVQWIPKGLRGEGHLLVFNNGGGRKPVEYSSVDEIVPPTDQDGNYTRGKRGPFGPTSAVWSYSAPNKKDFYSWFISGAQRLPNGNTLIDAGANGVVFEVTPEHEIVWKFVNPIKNMLGPPPSKKGEQKLVEVFSGFSRDMMGMKEDQRKKLDEIDIDLSSKLAKVLTEEQQKILADPIDLDFSKFPLPGEFLSAFKRNLLKLTDAQAKEMRDLQTDLDAKLAKILTDDQKHEFEKTRSAPPPAAGPAGPPRMGNTLFRATRYELSYPAFKGRTLTPGQTLVEIQRDLDSAQSKSAQRKTPDTSK